MKERTRWRLTLIVIVLGFLALVVIASNAGMTNHG